MVFVLDRHKKPLMPCSPKRARLFLSEVQHRGEAVHRGKLTQRHARRRRRSANLRYRAPRFANRATPKGWLPPSLRSRLGNILAWTSRYGRWTPISRIEVEQVRFDTQLLEHPEISGVEYQHGELAGWEMRAYLLLKYAYRCAYCGTTDVPFEIDHIQPRSRGGSHRISNLALACHSCNVAKGNQTAREFGHPEVQDSARRPLRDAAAVNATRFALVEALRRCGLPVGTWTGGRTRWNRARLGIEKTHANDALCVGEMAGVRLGKLKTLRIKATGRGEHCRTNWTAAGFPRGYRMRQKQVRGFKTGDLVRAGVPAPRKTAGIHRGRVAVRASGSFRVGNVDGINARYCRLVQRADGYEYAWA